MRRRAATRIMRTNKNQGVMPVRRRFVMKLQNKVAFVTGAAQGMGLAIARRFVEEGARVVAADINLDSLREGPASWATRWCRWFATPPTAPRWPKR